MTRTKEEALEKINGFRKDIVDGKTDLMTLATTESHCSSATKGGDLGVVRRGVMQSN